MREGLVSVIIPVYNSEKFINRCIDSILLQTYPSIEIIVVYNPSQDNTLKILKKYDTKINLILNKELNHPAISRNIGLKKAEGEYIALCDHDDFFASVKIEKQVRVLKESCYGLVYTDFIRVDVNANQIEIDRIRCSEWNRDKWLSSRFIVFSSILIRKCLFDYIGYLDEDEKIKGCDDFDLLIRLSKITKFKRIPEFLTYYGLHSNNLSKQIGMMNMSRARVFKKHNMLRKYLRSLIWVIPRDLTRMKIKEWSLFDSFYKN